MINTILNNLKNKNSINLGKTTNSKNCLIIHTSDYLANVLNTRIILAINGKAGQRQNYGNDKIVTFFSGMLPIMFYSLYFALPLASPPSKCLCWVDPNPIEFSQLGENPLKHLM